MNTNIKNTARMTLVTLAAMSATMLAGVTRAAEGADDLPTAAVSYEDLNLNSTAGVKVLYKRIERAANRVCGNFDQRDLNGTRVKQVCVERAIAEAIAQVNQEGVQTAAVAQVR